MPLEDAKKLKENIDLINSLSAETLELLQKVMPQLNGQSSVRKESGIPVSIFNEVLTPFESVCKYLVEDLEFSYIKISKLLFRDAAVIGVTYRKARNKLSKRFVLNYDVVIPLDIFNSDLSVFESLVLWLHDQNHSFNDIAKMLLRNYRTIWTIYNRAKKKGVNK